MGFAPLLPLLGSIVLSQFPTGQLVLKQQFSSALFQPTVRGEAVYLVEQGELRNALTSRTFGTAEVGTKRSATLVPFAANGWDVLDFVSEGRSLSMTFRILMKPRVVSLRITPPVSTLAADEVVRFQVMGVDQLGAQRLLNSAYWYSVGGDISPEGTFRAFGWRTPEPTRIEARYFDGENNFKAVHTIVIGARENDFEKKETLKEALNLEVKTKVFPFTGVVRERCHRYQDVCLLTEKFTNYGVKKEFISRYSDGRLLEVLRFDRNGSLSEQLFCNSFQEEIFKKGEFDVDCQNIEKINA